MAGEEAVSPEEEESDEKAESGHNDDEEDVDYMNHEAFLRRWSALTLPPKEHRERIFGGMSGASPITTCLIVE